MFKGSMVALVTPMNDDNSYDLVSLLNLIDWHIHAGTSALIILGTTGEASTLNDDEKHRIIETSVRHVDKRVPVIVGTGTNCTKSTIENSKRAQALGADGCLVVTPYYNKPTQKGLYQHFKSVAETISIPVILYNVPGRTGCDMLVPTVAELSKIKNIVGLKDATGSLNRLKELLNACEPDFLLYSGDDITSLDFLLNGGHGVISVTANVMPDILSQVCKSAMNSNEKDARMLNDRLKPLHEKLFVESNPIPTKWLLSHLKKIPNGIRMPLLPLDEKFHMEVLEAFEYAKRSSEPTIQ